MSNISCNHCGGKTEWFASMLNNSHVVDGRLKVSDVSCVFVLGCIECSETLVVRSADEVASNMNRPDFETESEKGWKAMTEEAARIQMQHLDKHEGDVYHAMQYLKVKFGKRATGPLIESIKETI